MSKENRVVLADMDEIDLAELEITRGDRRRIHADCAFGAYFYDASICEPHLSHHATHSRAPLYVPGEIVRQFEAADSGTQPDGEAGRPNVRSWRGHRQAHGTVAIRIVAAMSAALITWSIVGGIAAVDPAAARSTQCVVAA